jgi:hypothetical protein
MAVIIFIVKATETTVINYAARGVIYDSITFIVQATVLELLERVAEASLFNIQVGLKSDNKA